MLLLLSLALAQPAPPVSPEAAAVEDLPPEIRAMVELERSLTYEHGDIAVANGKATLHIPETYGFLDKTEANKVLMAWGNPDSPQVLGAIFPTGTTPFGENSWGAFLQYEHDGHVSDDDAKSINYDDLLKEMQAGEEADNNARKKAGFSALHLSGWAEPPHYDMASRKLHWAKMIEDDQKQTTLNYDIRVLGREGVLSVEAVAPGDQLPAVKAGMADLIQVVEFTPGNRYEDFNSSTDQVATVGLAALITGGAVAATKGGFLKGLLAMLIAGKKAVVAVVALAIGALKSLFSGKKNEEQ